LIIYIYICIYIYIYIYFFNKHTYIYIYIHTYILEHINASVWTENLAQHAPKFSKSQLISFFNCTSNQVKTFEIS